MFCKNCGAEIADNATFCPKCGGQVNQQSNPQRPPYGGPQQYNGGYRQPVRQNTAKGKVLLIISGILCLLGGIITLVSLFGTFAQASLLSAGLSWLGISVGGFWAYLVFSLVASVLLLVAGILAIANCSKREKADMVFKLGILVVVLRIIDWIWGSALVAGLMSVVTPASVILGLICPILMIVGGYLNKK